MIQCRLLIDPPGPGAWNMAVDEMLLEWSAAQRGCCLRFYGWREPTLSLGYFQEYRDRAGHGPSRDCPVVRRLTGGGAILHDAELTYSLVVPAGTRWPPAGRALPGRPRQPDRGAGRPGHRRGVVSTVPAAGPARSPFSVSSVARRATFWWATTKIAGSAQRRRRGAVLQHGSVLLRRSPAAPELPALEDAAGKTVEADATRRALAGETGPRGSPWSGCPACGRRRKTFAPPRW